jgi:hypothetical protein
MADHIALPLNYVDECISIITQPFLLCLRLLLPYRHMAEGSYSQAVPSLFFRPPTLDDLEAIHAIEVT